MMDKFTLSAADYAILSIMLAASVAIGLYFRIFGKQQSTNKEYLLAGKNMHIFPVSFSLMATFMSSQTLMGIPAEMYVFGTNMVLMNVGFILGPIIASFVFLPIYFNTGVSTAHEYLERRFGKTTRGILSWLFLFQNILYNGVSLYAPALALSAVTNLSMWMSAITVGCVCTFYCTLGGMRAVLWTDVLQSILMYVCLITIITKGCLNLGGFENIFRTAYEGGRILLPTIEMDFSVRYTMWSVFLQGLILTTYLYGGSQIQVQRQLTLKNIKQSKIATFCSIPMLVAFHLLCCLCGIIFYAHFHTCDPMTSDKHSIHSPDQLMPYYISSTMRDYPGLPGLCIAGIFSSSLSTISSAVNSMAAVTCEDIIRPFCPNLVGAVLITKIASVFYGILAIFVTFIVASLGNIVEAGILVASLVYAPVFGVFVLAVLTTTASEMGVNAGVISGFLLACCLTFIPNTRKYPSLPLGSNCSEAVDNAGNFSIPVDSNDESLNFTDLYKLNTTKPDLTDNFPVSFMWLTPISFLTTVIIGYFGSWIITYFRETTQNIPPELLSPVRQWFSQKKIENKTEDENYSGKETEL